MNEQDPAQGRGSRKLTLPRWAIPLVWAVLVAAIQVVLPWAIAKIGPRFGWTEAGPGNWNRAGLVAVALGLGLYIWCLVFHFVNYPPSVDVGFTPPVLVVSGPYRFSRNPMYLAALVAWLGWVIYFGSLAVFVALLILWSAFALRVIPMEERQLEGMFGDDYVAYKQRVRRWFGRR